MKRPRVRGLLLGLAALSLVVILLLAAGWFPQEPLRAFVEQRLRQRLGPRALIGRLHVVPGKLRAEIDGLGLDTPGYRLLVPHAQVEVGWGLLLRGALDFRALEAESPEIVLRAVATGAAPEPLAAIRIDRLAIRNASLRYQDPALPGEVRLHGLGANGAVGSGTLDVQFEGGSWPLAEGQVPLGPARARLALSPSLDLTIDSLEAAVRGSRLAIKGTVRNAVPRVADLRVESDLDLADVQAILNGPVMAGHLALTGTLMGPTDGLRASLTGQGPALEFSGEPIGRASAVAEWDVAKGTGSGRLTADVRGGRVDVKGRLTGKRLQADIAAEGLVLPGSHGDARLTAEGDLDGEVAVKGTVGARSDATATRAYRMSGEVTGRLRPRQAWLEAALDGRATVEPPAGPLDVPVVATLAYHDGRLQSHLESRSRAGSLEADLASAGSRIERLAVKGSEIDLSLVPGMVGRASLEWEGAGPVEKLSGPGRARAEGLVWNGVDVGVVSLDAVLRDGLATVQLAVPSLNATGSGRVSLAAPPTANLRVTLTDSPLASFASLLGTKQPVLGQPVLGKIQGELALRGRLAEPDLSGQVRMTELAWGRPGEEPIVRIAEARVSLQARRITLQPIEAQVAGGTVRLRGEGTLRSNLTGAGLPVEEIQADVSWEGVPSAGLYELLQGQPSPVQGPLSGAFQVRGNPGAPATLVGHGRSEAASLHVEDVDVELAPFTVELSAGRLSTAGLVVTSGGGRLVAQARSDLVARTVAATAQGVLELRALAPFFKQMSLGGIAEVDLTAEGPWAAPVAKGELVLRDATLRLRDFAQALTRVNGRLTFDRTGIRLTDIAGRLGGGEVTVAGHADLKGAAIEAVRLELVGKDMTVRHRSGARGRFEAQLVLTGRPTQFLLAGRVEIERALYDTDVFLDEALFGPAIPPATGEPGILETVALDVTIATRGRVLVRNNLAELAATGQVRVRGDLSQPAPFGRLEARRGGKVFLQTREFTIESGQLIYTGTLEPEVAIRARSRIPQVGGEDVDVTLDLSGPLRKPELKFESDPSYSEREIASLIATGRRNIALDSGAWVAGEQAAALLAGRLTRNVSRTLQDLGLDEVTVQPSLLAREADPGVRFTFGKQFTPRLKLVYSLGLNDAEARFFEVQYQLRWGREITLKLVREDDGTISYGAGQRLRLGGPRRRARAARQERLPVQAIRFEGEPPLPTRALESELGTRVGKPASDWDLQDDAERLQASLAKKGYLDALVDARLDTGTAVFDVRAGPLYRFEVRGMPEPPDLGRIVRDAVFAEEALDRGQERLLAEARRRGFLKAEVAAVNRPDESGGAVLLFTVELGSPITVDAVTFPGAHALSHGRLLDAAGGAAALLAEPASAKERILAEYRKENYLEARVGALATTPSADGSRVGLAVPVVEGRIARVVAVRFEGASDPEKLRRLAALEPGKLYDREAAASATQRVRDHYLKRGYAAVRVTPRLVPTDADLQLVFAVVEGPSVRVGEVVIKGLDRTRESTVRRQVRLARGQPLDPRKLAATEKRLRDLGVFSRVVASASADDPATVTIEVTEQGPYSLSYDLRYNDRDLLQGVVDGEVGNLFGRAWSFGARYRAARDIRDFRMSFGIPSVGRAGDASLVLSRTEERFPEIRELLPGEAPLPFAPRREIRDGVQLQQTLHLRRRLDLLYGYRFERTTGAGTAFQQDLAGLQVSLLREGRDNPIDARKGTFWSVSLDLGQTALGSDLRFTRVFAQVFDARALSSDWTWAQGLRLGLAQGLRDAKLTQTEVALFGRSTELFRAGGGNSLRGFATDSVGPAGPVAGLSSGGEAVAILNEELRYHHPSGFGAAFFYDGGNVFARVEDSSLRWRHSVGVGLRYGSPFGLVRLDLGFPLGRRPEERSYQWFISLGQAF